MHCLLNTFLRFGAIFQMAPKRIMQTIRGQPRKTRRRVAPSAAAGSAVATSDTPTGLDDSIGPDAGTGSTAYVTPEATLADTIAAAVLRQLEQSGRLLPIFRTLLFTPPDTDTDYITLVAMFTEYSF